MSTCERAWWSLAVVLALALTACAGATRHWPTRGGLVCVVNDQTVPVYVVAEDEMGRLLRKGRVWPGGRLVFRWPFIAERGQLSAGDGRVTLWSARTFEPWTVDRWAWWIGKLEAVPDTGKIRRC